MRLATRLDALKRRRTPVLVRNALTHARATEDAAIAIICASLEGPAPIPAGEMYADVETRLDAALDRLYAAGVGIATGPHTSRAERIAAAWGMPYTEFRDLIRERAGR